LVSVDSDHEEHTGEGLKIQRAPESNSGMATNHMDFNHFEKKKKQAWVAQQLPRTFNYVHRKFARVTENMSSTKLVLHSSA